MNRLVMRHWLLQNLTEIVEKLCWCDSELLSGSANGVHSLSYPRKN
jgi:hypothetical protein